MTDFDDDAIAVVGVAARLPGAPDLAAFAALLHRADEAVHELSRDQLRQAGVPEQLIEHPNYVARTASLAGWDEFDPAPFELSVREAELLDPQHRLFLETTWRALEDAGYPPRGDKPLTAIFGGAGSPHYLIAAHVDGQVTPLNRDAVMTAADKDFMVTRAAHRLGIEGPAVNVQTACSSSLVAVHLARQSLLLGEVDLALAGGASVRIPQLAGYRYATGGILAADGHCRPYEARATGTVNGSGCGVVVLRRLADAAADGDRILAVIRGSAVLNDGTDRAGFTAPGMSGQVRTLETALAVAGVEAGELDYLEGHGTGTALGDAVELGALGQVLGERDRPCLIGSVKANIGHLGPASGVAGLIKTILALRDELLPAQPDFGSPADAVLANPAIQVLAQPVPWPADPARARTAGISSFGMGGTNAHLIVQDYHRATAAEADLAGLPELIVVSGADRQAAEDTARAVSAGLPAVSLAAAGSLLRTGRTPLAHRVAVVGRTPEQAAAALTAAGPQPVTARLRIGFAFPGQGSQRPGMADGLLQFPAARLIFEQALQVLATEPAAPDLKTALLDRSADPDWCANTAIAQPAILVTNLMTAAALTHYGLAADAVVGHSVGEYAALVLAGVLGFDQALRAVLRRGALMAELPAGGMTAVFASAEQLAGYPEVEIAALNGAAATVIAGDLVALDRTEVALSQHGIRWRRLRTSHAFHTTMMRPMVEQYAAVAPRLAAVPRIALLSTVTGRCYRDEPLPADLLIEQLCQPVRFAEAVAAIGDQRPTCWIEVGPGAGLQPSLGRLAAGQPVLASAARSEAGPDADSVASCAARAWALGATGHWQRTAPVCQLPTYQFHRRRFWLTDAVEPGAGPSGPATADATSAAMAATAGAEAVTVEAVAELWTALIGVRELEPSDDFFALGADSLAAVGLVAQLGDRFGIAVDAQWPFEHPSLGAQVADLHVRQRENRDRNG